MNVFLTIGVSTEVKLAVARSMGHTNPATYPVVKRWMERTLESAMEDLVTTHLSHPGKPRPK